MPQQPANAHKSASEISGWFCNGEVTVAVIVVPTNNQKQQTPTNPQPNLGWFCDGAPHLGDGEHEVLEDVQPLVGLVVHLRLPPHGRACSGSGASDTRLVRAHAHVNAVDAQRLCRRASPASPRARAEGQQDRTAHRCSPPSCRSCHRCQPHATPSSWRWGRRWPVRTGVRGA